MSIRAVIFDLDGVITDTAVYHAQAWQTLANSLGIAFDDNDNEALKGVDRMASLDFILAKGQIEKTIFEKQALADQKNHHYRSLIASMTTTDILPGAAQLLQNLRQHGLLLGLASSSKNAALVLDRLDIGHYFDYVADAQLIKNNKPDPEIFLTVAKALQVPARYCVGIEDSGAGVKAINAANMLSVGIGNHAYLSHANLIYSSLEHFDLDEVKRTIISTAII